MAAKIANIFCLLADEPRRKVLIIDDSTYERSHSKFVKLLAKVSAHSDRRFLKGFKMLTVGWTDGTSFLPFYFASLTRRWVVEVSPSCSKHFRKISPAIKSIPLPIWFCCILPLQSSPTEKLELSTDKIKSYYFSKPWRFIINAFPFPYVSSENRPAWSIFSFSSYLASRSFGMASFTIAML